MEKIKVGIVGYGNLGKGLEINIKDNKDMELVGIFSRRDPSKLNTNSPTFHYSEINNFINKIDIMILAGSSKKDIRKQAYEIAKNFNTLDAFDTHNLIPEYFKELNKINIENGTSSLISTGWDPGLFSLNRRLSEAILPKGMSYTFWGPGISQGHSDAIRTIEGVRDAIQYTIPIEKNIEKIRKGENPKLETRDKHKRICYVVLENGYSEKEIRDKIVNMEDYFIDYDTEVNFISYEELKKNHSKLPHGGRVIRNGLTGDNNKEIYEFALKLDSNPEFTSAVMLSYGRALYKLHKNGHKGTLTILDIAPRDLLNMNRDEILKLI